MGNLEINQRQDKSLLSDAQRVQDFQRKIYRKAKQEKAFRFYALYDKVRLPYFLKESYKRCKANKGSAGVDGVSFKDIEKNGVETFLLEIKEELKNKTYKPQAVLRVEIPKANGKTRPLGIPTIKDRVIQMATKLAIEPIFEADFEDSSYGFRPRRSACDAISAIKENLKQCKNDVFDADLSAYFDTIPHKELMVLIAQRLSDKYILHLIKMWLKAPVMKDGRPTGGKKKKVGTPQGGVISPLLANIYLHLLDKAVNRINSLFQINGIKIVRYADDFVLMARNIPQQCYERLYGILGRMKLQLNTDKSKVVKAREEPFDFLGHTFRYNDSLLYSGKYWKVEPSDKSLKKVRAKIRDYLSRNGHKSPSIVAIDINAITRGWLNYFIIDKVSNPYVAKKKLSYYLSSKLQRFYKRKSQRKSKLYNRGAFKVLVQKYGLIDPIKYVPS